MQTDRRRERGQRTRETVLDAAVALASVHGLEGLTFGRLAEHLGTSKSGLFAHWRDKEHLQLDAIDQARRQWTDRVMAPALRTPPGIRRVFALHEARMAFYADGVLPGGCFFLAAQTEFDDRPGAVQAKTAQALHDWLAFIRSLVDEAIALGELTEDADPDQLAYEIDALGESAVIHSRLVGHEVTFARARRAVLARLRALATDPATLPED
ncbi:TetR family transcriptional regulator [Amycolatopsis deserti]|uniref:TetR family transcriptional regulator n=1 Tax=Amycolatopsis deserti TaxID=185696 RepID=A0ABQ3J5E6_9PSEU|nr:TetR/AcrR family transcriptional regulator [Amycolatopsis deserti]GHF05670.1 TetR family transcriptional regulator [Amycolatopsis deserti]